VEDRITPGLYLEMSDLSPDVYAATRVDDVLGMPAVERATWWRNVHRDRRDLPRVLPEFSLLGVYEVGTGFSAPASMPAGITGYHFEHYRRPGQGIVTGAPTLGLSLVLISPKSPELAQELRDWADFVHIRHIAAAAVPGYSMITPYEQVGGGDPRFMHFYEIDTEDAERVFKSMTPLVMSRIGGVDTDAFKEWATCPALRIMYVNSFARIGERSRS